RTCGARFLTPTRRDSGTRCTRSKQRWSACSRSSLPLQQLERVRPAVVEESGNAPEHGEGFDCPRPFNRSHVRDLEPELIEDRLHLAFWAAVGATGKHGRRGA